MEANRTFLGLLMAGPVKTAITVMACTTLRLMPDRQFTALLRTTNPTLA